MTEPATPETPPRAIPDLGFFAGPAQRSGSSTFGGSSGFGAARPAQQHAEAPAGNQFGGAPAPVFGAPTPVFGTPGAPVYAAPSLQRKPSSGWLSYPAGIRGVGVTLVLLLVAASIGYNRFTFIENLVRGDLEPPASLSGAPRLTGPDVAELERLGKEQIHGPGSGSAFVAVYGDTTAFFSLAAHRGRADIEREFSDSGGGAGSLVTIGENTCGPIPDGNVCARTGRRLSVFVATSASPERASAAVDEAWGAL